MAKSARSSTTKRNHQNLRAKVFGPASDARTARLSAKLQKLAASSVDKKMDTEDRSTMVKHNTDQNGAGADLDVSSGNDQLCFHNESFSLIEQADMDVDDDGNEPKTPRRNLKKSRPNRKPHRVSKRRSKANPVFPSERARKAKMASKKKKTTR